MRAQRIRRRLLRRQQSRRGIQVLELILAFPALMLLLFAGVQFSLTSTVRNTVSAAAHEASRCFEIDGDINDAEAIVDQMLSVHGMAIGPGVRLVIQDDTGAIQSVGDGSLSSDVLLTAPPAGTVRALLIVDLDATPAPNMLTAYCVDFSNRQLECSSVVTRFREC